MPVAETIAIQRAENALIVDTPWGHFNVPHTQEPEHAAVPADVVANTARTHVGDVPIERVGIDWEPAADGSGSPSVWWDQSPAYPTPLVVLIRESDGAELRPTFTGSSGDGFYTTEYFNIAGECLRFWVVFVLPDRPPSALLLSPMRERLL